MHAEYLTTFSRNHHTVTMQIVCIQYVTVQPTNTYTRESARSVETKHARLLYWDYRLQFVMFHVILQ